MVEMGIFTPLALFLKPLYKFVKLNNILLHIRNTVYSLFFLIVMMIKRIGALFSLLFIFLGNRIISCS